jgi:hypothetical protein
VQIILWRDSSNPRDGLGDLRGLVQNLGFEKIFVGMTFQRLTLQAAALAQTK